MLSGLVEEMWGVAGLIESRAMAMPADHVASALQNKLATSMATKITALTSLGTVQAQSLMQAVIDSGYDAQGKEMAVNAIDKRLETTLGQDPIQRGRGQPYPDAYESVVVVYTTDCRLYP